MFYKIPMCGNPEESPGSRLGEEGRIWFSWWFVPQDRAQCERKKKTRKKKKTRVNYDRVGIGQREACQSATVFTMVGKLRAPEPAGHGDAPIHLTHGQAGCTVSRLRRRGIHAWFQIDFWLGAYKLHVPRFEQIKNIKKKKSVLPLLLLYFYFMVGAFSFDLLTGMYFFLVPPLPLPATFQVTNFSA